MLNLSKTSGVERSLNRARDRHRTDKQYNQRRAFIRSLHEHPEATNAPRKKLRAKSLADVPTSRKRLRGSRVAAVDLSALVKTILLADDEKTTKRFEHESPKIAKASNTARERRREHLKINLE